MLFYYKRTIKAEKDGEADKVYEDFFNTECVVRGVWVDDDTQVLLLNDRHEASEIIEPALFNKEGKKVREAVKSRISKVSEIYLTKEDALKFQELSQ